MKPTTTTMAAAAAAAMVSATTLALLALVVLIVVVPLTLEADLVALFDGKVYIFIIVSSGNDMHKRRPRELK